jgi:glycosyltransferase involved in cell wall biosynthesis
MLVAVTRACRKCSGRRVRILYVDTGLGMAGGQSSLLQILKRLDTSRFSATVATPPGSALRASCKDLGVNWLPLPFESSHLESDLSRSRLGGVKDLYRCLRGIHYLARIMREHDIDVLHANTFKAALVGGPACRLAARRLVFHDRICLTHGILGRAVASLADRIIAVSNKVAAKHRGRNRTKVIVVYDGVDTLELIPPAKGGHRGFVAYLGRISSEKGLHYLVEGAPAVLAAVPDVKFAIGGVPWTPADEAYLGGLRKRIAELGLLDRFEFRGYVGDVGTFLSQAAVAVVPSEREGLGIAMLEAMALERPVVAFRVGGPGEVLSHGKDGILVDPGDTAGLTAAIVDLIGDSVKARRMGKAARRTVVSRFSSEAFARKIMEVYE